jgi:predicted RNase H-like nuclease (RuvC/YqgF family)
VAILGIDVAPGGSFAYAVLEGGSVVEKGVLDARGLAHLFKRYKVEILAVDNVGELFQYGRPVVRLLGKLPYAVDVVEVTRGPEGYRKVEDLVRERFAVVRGRLEPLETAEYLAVLANMGTGTSVKLFEEETVILIYRRISTAPGGMSRNRFMRNVTHRIKSLASKIEAKLKEARLDYDLFIREESGEVASAKFVVYAKKEVVRRYVKPMRSIDVAIAIYSTPVKRGGAAARGRLLILGVDPGVVTGLAILTLDGEVLDTAARRGFSRGDVMRYVQQWGTPVVVATDVADPPEFVKRLAAMSGAMLYTPSRDLSSVRKDRERIRRHLEV